MKRTKKIVSGFLIFILLLQLLPIKQAIKYFFIDNIMVEEILEVSKKATKNFRLIDEDHSFTSDIENVSKIKNEIESISSFHYIENLPAQHITDVLTPPPNC